MSEHLCNTYTLGCFRCALNKEEEEAMSNDDNTQEQEYVSYSHCTFIPDVGGAVPDEQLPMFDVVSVTEDGVDVLCLTLTTPTMGAVVLAHFHQDAPLDAVLQSVYLLTKCRLRSWTDQTDSILNPTEGKETF
jgi:hypothetical protein